MIIALLVIMFIVLVVLAKLIKENKEIVEALDYVIDCNFKNDLGLDKGIAKLEEKIEELEVVIDATNKYTHERLMELEVRVYELEGPMDDAIKTGTIPKTCSIDGKCNYMDKFTTVK